MGAEPHYRVDYIGSIAKNITGRYSQNFDTLLANQFVTHSVSLWTITHIVSDPINLYRYPCSGTVEIKNVFTKRMLAAKLHSLRRSAQKPPQQDFRQRHFRAEPPGMF